MNQTATERELIEFILKHTDVLLENKPMTEAYQSGNYTLLHEEMIAYFCDVLEKEPQIAVKIVQGLLRQNGSWRVLWYLVSIFGRNST